jgi:hypothetical protein
MSIVIGVGQNTMEIQEGQLEIANFRQYRIFQEGNKTPITGFDESLKSLKLVVTNGVVDIIINNSSANTANQMYDETLFINKYVPEGYELIDTKESAKLIKGLKGKYYYYYNKESEAYLALVSRGGSKPNRIALGSLGDHSSTLYRVLDKLPKDRAFHKAELNSLLPAKIVENRQPIKAALDILEREGFVKKTGNKVGVSEEYIGSNKATPTTGMDKHLPTLDDHIES